MNTTVITILIMILVPSISGLLWLSYHHPRAYFKVMIAGIICDFIVASALGSWYLAIMSAKQVVADSVSTETIAALEGLLPSSWWFTVLSFIFMALVFIQFLDGLKLDSSK